MAVTVEYQAWDSASYNWLDNSTSTAAPQQINDKLSAWVTAVNANASNTNKQITIEKGPADSTSANFVGWTLQLASDTTGSAFFLQFYTPSTTAFNMYVSSSWTNNGSNGGYGSAAGSVSSDSVSFYTSGVEAEFSIASDTTDGQEFFCLGWRHNNSTSYSDCWLIFKDSNGEWASVFTDGGAASGTYYMPTHETPSRNFSVGISLIGNNSNLGFLTQLVLTNASSNYAPSASYEYTAAVAAANPNLYTTGTTSEYGYARWANVSGGRKAVCMGYTRIWVVY
jgi:hypothetical protein